jgi:hypothetical protein
MEQEALYVCEQFIIIVDCRIRREREMRKRERVSRRDLG